MQRVEQAEKLLDEFERALGEIRDVNNENLQNLYPLIIYHYYWHKTQSIGIFFFF